MTAENQQAESPKACTIMDGIINKVGNSFSWLNMILLAVIILQVVLRYVFGRGVVILEELQFIFYGIMLILAVSYTLVADGHIRLDLFHARFTQRTKEKIEIFGIIVLLFPMIVVIFIHGTGLLVESWHVGERSGAPMGLCCYWAFKAFIPLGMILLAMGALSRLIKAFAFLKRSPKENN